MWLLGRVSVRRKYQILGLCFRSLALFLLLALTTRDPRDTAADLVGTGAVRNQAGVLGALAAAGLVTALGAVGSWIVPVTLLAWGWNRLRLRPAGDLWLRTGLGAAAFLAGSGLLYLLAGENRSWVGAVGAGIGRFTARFLGTIGGELVLGTGLVILCVVAFELGTASTLRQLLAAALTRLAPAGNSRKRRAGSAAPEAESEGAGAAAVAEPPGPLARGKRGRPAPAEEEADLERAFTPARPAPPKESRPRIVGRDESRPEPLAI